MVTRAGWEEQTGTADELVLGGLAAVDEDGVAAGKLDCGARDVALGRRAPGRGPDKHDAVEHGTHSVVLVVVVLMVAFRIEEK